MNSGTVLVAVAILLAVSLQTEAEPALRVLGTSRSGTPLLTNGSFEQLSAAKPEPWRAWGEGFRHEPTGGRNGSAAVSCERAENGPEFGASQTILMNRTHVAPLVIRGWSKADRVSGSPDNGYSLYVDVIYADGSTLWGRTAPFNCGTHDWLQREFVLVPEKPIRSLTLHCLFRGHTGKAWFDDVALEEVVTPAGAVLLHGVPVEPAPVASIPAGPSRAYASGDGLRLTMTDGSVASLDFNGRPLAASAPSGFLARDFAAGSDMFTFSNGVCRELGLRLETRIESTSNHVALSAKLVDTRGQDRAITLFFALPVNALDWSWGDDARSSREIGGAGEYANTVPARSGAAGRMSRYPLGAIWNREAGLALGLDMARPAQYTIACNPGTRQFYLAYDIALTKETDKCPSAAELRFVVYGFDPKWGFRSALQKFYDIFPAHFVKRVPREGVWMPFTDISRVPDFQDFGFAFQEGAPNVAFDDAHGIASFVYVEPMSHWLALPADTPRTYEAALEVLRADAGGARDAEKRKMGGATLTSGIHTADGQFALYLVKAPWCDGGVFTLNPDPDLEPGPVFKAQGSGMFTKASVMRAAIDQAFQRNRSTTNASPPGAGLDGVYLDSFEMSAAELNYRREHFIKADVPLVFDGGGRACQMMVFNTYEFARDLAERLHREGRLCFANAVLWNYSFPAPLLDVLGTEVNWLRNGEYTPDTDSVMNFRRALCRQKPYCLLLNTDYSRFDSKMVERFFQRCLFYGVWPGFFDEEAASKDPYWGSAKRWYERDRPLFRKYIPLLRRVTAAGWEPVTGVSTPDPALWLERFGTPGEGECLVTVFNSAPNPLTGSVRLEANLLKSIRPGPVTDQVSGEVFDFKDGGWSVRLEPHQTAVLKLQ